MAKDTNDPNSLSPDNDASVGEEDLKAYTNGPDLIGKVGRVFQRLDADFSAEYERHVKIGLLDIPDEIDPTKGGGFARVVGRTGVFVRVNISGDRWDVVGLIHEMGHVFGLRASSSIHPYHLLWPYAQDFMETPSSVMEMLSMPYWDEFYQGAALAKVKREYFRGMVIVNLESIIIEAFQLWAYSHLDEARDAAQCSAKWLELYEKYMPNGNWQEWREEVTRGWQYMVQLFHAPLFTMEYVYGRLAGLNLLNAPDAIARYKQATRLGGSAGVKELFTTLGTHFFFTAEDVANAAQQIESYLVS